MMFDDSEVKRLIQEAIKKLKVLVGRQISGDISWQQFKVAIFKLIRTLYRSTATAATGELSKEDREMVESALAEQLYPHGQDFSLTEKLQDHEDGLVSLNQLVQSLTMYLASSRASALSVWASHSSDKLAIRTLGATDKHCDRCLLYAGLPPMKLSDVVIPGRRCDCLSNCRCSIIVMN